MREPSAPRLVVKGLERLDHQGLEPLEGGVHAERVVCSGKGCIRENPHWRSGIVMTPADAGEVAQVA